LLKGKTDEEVAAAYAGENKDADPAAVTTAIAKIRSSVIFRPLLI
jgi:hypothetical protein